MSLGGSDATPAFDLSDATNYPASSLTGTVTNAQLAGSIAHSKLADISNLHVLGNTTGSASAPEPVEVLDEDTLASDSPTSLATQQSIKAYVDSNALVNGIKRGTAWVSSGSDITIGTQIDGHSGCWKITHKIETTADGNGKLTGASLVADYQLKSTNDISKALSLPDSVWDIPSDGVLQLR